jgi:TetR/AcrR family transcriptional repressor of nem operon
MAMLLRHGFHGLGMQALLAAAETPKGSFYHFFRDKEDFALEAIDYYLGGVHVALGASLTATDRPPLARIRLFFEMVEQSYERDGYLGCLMGGLGQELSGVSARFRVSIERCFTEIADGLRTCLEEAQERGDIASDAEPRRLAVLLVDCWEGAALRSRLRSSPEPLHAMLDFYFGAVATARTGMAAHLAMSSPSS